MDRAETDVAVVGGGPAGIAAALSALRAGLRVRLIDPGLPVRPRVESLPPGGIALAGCLGLDRALGAAGLGRAAAMRLLWRARPEVRAFGADAPLLLDKPAFHDALRAMLPPGCLLPARVRSLRARPDGVDLCHDGGVMAARFVIDARGRAGLRGRHGGGAVVLALAFAGRLAIAPTQPLMVLEALADGWLWACVLPSGLVRGAVHLPAAALAGLSADRRAARLARDLAASDLGLPGRLVAGDVAPAMLQAAPDPFAAPRVLRIGDAALAQDPVAAHGLTHALRSGVQAASAVATLLDPQGAADAARDFIRTRHQAAVRSAETATARALADQARHRGGFWAVRREASGPPPTPWPALTGPLRLAPLIRAAEMQGGRIRWAPALWLPGTGQAQTRFGPLTAETIALALDRPGRLAELAQRLARVTDAATAAAILRHLMDGGALQAADPATRAQSAPAMASRS